MFPKPNKSTLEETNYRPISLLTSLSKLLEHVHPLITIYQSGYIKDRQTRDALFRVVQRGRDALNTSKCSAILLIDLTKVFDKIWHESLLFKLDKLNIPNWLGKWLRNYLPGRTFSTI
eukprot:Pgem_evm2s2309